MEFVFTIDNESGIITYKGTQTIPVKVSVNFSTNGTTSSLGYVIRGNLSKNGSTEDTTNQARTQISYLKGTSAGLAFTDMITMQFNDCLQLGFWTSALTSHNIIDLTITCEGIPV